MNKQLKRLCINHWKRMLKLTVKDIREGREEPTPENCAFCGEYFEQCCFECPVKEKSGHTNCYNTPYEAAANLYGQISRHKHKRIKAFHKAVQKEVEFLESLEV